MKIPENNKIATIKMNTGILKAGKSLGDIIHCITLDLEEKIEIHLFQKRT